MEIHGKPGRIQISANTKMVLELTEAEGYAITSRGRISVKVPIRNLNLYFNWQRTVNPSVCQEIHNCNHHLENGHLQMGTF